MAVFHIFQCMILHSSLAYYPHQRFVFSSSLKLEEQMYSSIYRGRNVSSFIASSTLIVSNGIELEGILPSFNTGVCF